MFKGFWLAVKVSSERGAALVELAISMPVFLMLVMGLVEYANILTRYQDISIAAREAARLGASIIDIDNAFIARGDLLPEDRLFCNHFSEEVGPCTKDSADSVECRALLQARSCLTNAGYSIDKWEIKVSINPDEPTSLSDDVAVHLLQVEISGNLSDHCILCLTNLISNVKFTAKSSFSWEPGGCI